MFQARTSRKNKWDRAIIGEMGSSIPHPAAAGTDVAVVTWLVCAVYEVIYVFPPWLPRGSVCMRAGLWGHFLPGVASDLFAKPWKPIPHSHSCCQRPLWQLWHISIQKTSRGIESDSLNHDGRVLASPSHYEASDEFITSGLTNGFKRHVSAPLETRWRQQKPVGPPHSWLRGGLASPRLDSSAWWKGWTNSLFWADQCKLNQ